MSNGNVNKIIRSTTSALVVLSALAKFIEALFTLLAIPEPTISHTGVVAPGLRCLRLQSCSLR